MEMIRNNRIAKHSNISCIRTFLINIISWFSFNYTPCTTFAWYLLLYLSTMAGATYVAGTAYPFWVIPCYIMGSMFFIFCFLCVFFFAQVNYHCWNRGPSCSWSYSSWIYRSVFFSKYSAFLKLTDTIQLKYFWKVTLHTIALNILEHLWRRYTNSHLIHRTFMYGV